MALHKPGVFPRWLGLLGRRNHVYYTLYQSRLAWSLFDGAQEFTLGSSRGQITC
jgi:hypothetical protein